MTHVHEFDPASRRCKACGLGASEAEDVTWVDRPPIAQVAVEGLTGDPAHDLQVFQRAIDEANATASRTVCRPSRWSLGITISGEPIAPDAHITVQPAAADMVHVTFSPTTPKV